MIIKCLSTLRHVAWYQKKQALQSHTQTSGTSKVPRVSVLCMCHNTCFWSWPLLSSWLLFRWCCLCSPLFGIFAFVLQRVILWKLDNRNMLLKFKRSSSHSSQSVALCPFLSFPSSLAWRTWTPFVVITSHRKACFSALRFVFFYEVW